MGIADFLGLGAPGGDPFGMTTQYADGTSASAQPAPQAPAYQPLQRPHGLHGILDSIGDALLIAHGVAPIHQQHFEEAQQRQALSGFLTNPDQAIQQLMQIDPKSGIELWRSAHPPSEKTMEQKVYEYEQGLPPEQRPAFERSIQLTHPGMGTPVQVESGSLINGQPVGTPANLPTVASQADYDKLPPGAPYRDANGRVGTKGGATGKTPSPTFR